MARIPNENMYNFAFRSKDEKKKFKVAASNNSTTIQDMIRKALDEKYPKLITK